ncbi:SMP-30/gluconolactonase/LRE family protein [Mucilaginibacter ginsenosidivorax]|uniref:Regucalcin n=1 Tax=Mucilaginibacter ginsenosidivorax TaxID=862126 RepID=A0A5B8VXJ5_9SPHI|nr:SMP-30/gluconolactonase/LRE family protein [Mucilaginibacter ginsenosidivorax]QEC76139.1 SMP-30/gluconolactonase/LRE family protein [Mucilaginibacter ginsenosidivorax]
MVEVAVNHASFLGEGPVWDWRDNILYWVDIMGGHIHEYKPENKNFRTIDVNQMVGAVVACSDRQLLAALKNGLAMIDRESGEPAFLVHPEAHLPQNRFNDGKCDPAGRFWIGSMAIDETPNAGKLYMLNGKQDIAAKIHGTTISNGMAWSHDHKTFYYIDTPTMNVVAYDFDVHSGTISNKKTVITIDEKDGYPDGMTIDTDGMLWIAHWNGWQVSRWNPHTATKLFTLPLPVANVTSCTFGGPNLNDLYITTAQKGLTANELEQQPLAGMLFVWKDCGYEGVRAFEYAKGE